MSIKDLQKPQQKKFSSEIDSELLNQVKKMCKGKKIKLKQALEYGLKKFLEDCED